MGIILYARSRLASAGALPLGERGAPGAISRSAWMVGLLEYPWRWRVLLAGDTASVIFAGAWSDVAKCNFARGGSRVYTG